MTARLAAAGALLAAVVLASCSGEDDHDLGEAVEVEFHDAESKPVATGTVAVTAVRKGAVSELDEAGFTLDAEQSQATVYYVDVAFENTGDDAVTPSSPGGEDPDGNLLPAPTVIELSGETTPFEPCAGVPDELPASEAAEGCAVVLVPEETEMERIYYHPGGAADFVYWAAE